VEVAAAHRLALLLALVAGCAGGKALTIAGPDDDAATMARVSALAARGPAPPARPVIYAAVASGGLAAWDLDAGRPIWEAPASVDSRVVVTGSLVAGREGGAVVALAARDGSRRWSVPLPSGLALAGLAADAERVYALVTDGRKRWTLLAYGEAGAELWRFEAEGALGAPAAQAGLVYLPYLSQWLVVLDARTGERLARLRHAEEAVSWVRATPEAVTFGTHAATTLDPRRSATPRLPDLARLPLHLPAFDPVAATFSAIDRKRLLWRPAAEGGFADGTVALLWVRYLLGFDAGTGATRWARTLPADALAAEDTGAALVVVTREGTALALDRGSGRLLSERQLGVRLLGATIAAEGWRPAGEGEPAPALVEGLTAIALDRDTRFAPPKLHAVTALAALPETEGARALVEIAGGETAERGVARAAGEALVAGATPAKGPVLVEALAVHADHAAGRAPRAVEVLARALAAIDPPPPEGAAAIVAHVDDPATPPDTVAALAKTLVAMRATPALPRLASVLLLHRCDERFASTAAALGDAIAALGGPAERELLAFVAADPRTAAPLREHLQTLLRSPAP
jgi:hypothetical protein